MKLPIRPLGPGAIAMGAALCAAICANLALAGMSILDLAAGELVEVGTAGLIGSAVASAALGALAGWGWCHAVPSERCIRLGEDALEAPRSLYSRRMLRVGYGDITSITAYPSRALHKRRAVLLIGIGDRFPIQIGRKDLIGSPPLRSIWDELLRRIAAAAGDGSRLDALNRKARLWERVEGSWSRTGLAIGGLLIAFWVHVWLFAPPSDPVADEVSARAAVGAWLLHGGGLFRIFSAPLYSYSLMHAVGNALATVLLFKILGPLVGPARVLIVMIVGGVVAPGMYAILSAKSVSVGASGGGMALTGMLVAIRVLRRHELPGILRFPLILFPVILVLDVVDWWVSSRSSVLPHLAGLACGLLLTPLLLRSQGELGATVRSAWVTAAAFGLSALMIFGGLRSFGVLGEASQIQALRAAKHVLSTPPPDRPEVAAAAWLVARRPEASRELLSLAADRYLETPNVAERPNELLARLWYRSGRVGEGIREERATLKSHSNEELSSVLIAMEWGALERGIEVDPPSARIGERLQLDRGVLQLAVPGAIELDANGNGGFELHVFVVLDEEPVGVLQIQTGELSSSIPVPAWVTDSVPQGAELVLGAVYPVEDRPATNRVCYHDDFDWQQFAPLYSLKRPAASSTQISEPNRDA